MENQPKIRVKFWMTGDKFDIDEVTKLMNVEPTKARKKEECPVEMTALTSWMLATEKEECKAVTLQFNKLIKQLLGKEEIINQICKLYNLETVFEVVIEMESDGRPELVLTKEIVSFVSSINAEIGFDLYVD